MSGDIEQLKAQLVDVQTQLAFQEDVVSTLNGELVRQQTDIDLLNSRFDDIQEQLLNALDQAGAGGSENSGNEKPPHY
jgi:SlyX protein